MKLINDKTGLIEINKNYIYLDSILSICEDVGTRFAGMNSDLMCTSTPTFIIAVVYKYENKRTEIVYDNKKTSDEDLEKLIKTWDNYKRDQLEQVAILKG